jgi:XRE family transcriptional regulator, regulator of sulfur utilization
MSEIRLRNIIGERIRDKCKEKGLSQDELAERAGIHPTYIGQLELAKNQLQLIAWKK